MTGVPEAQRYETVVEARDPVGTAAIRAWCDAMGDRNPIYVDQAAAVSHGHPGIVAPPAMLHAWTMPGLAGHRPEHRPGVERIKSDLLAEDGYDAVVATNYEQRYARYLTVGDRISERSWIEQLSDPKTTRIGEGRFVSTRHEFVDADGQVVGEMGLRVFIFRGHEPAEPASPSEDRPRPAAEPREDGELGGLDVDVTPTLVIAGALASNDFERVHHDRDLAQSQGLPDIIMNILTSSGLVQRFVTDWTGPAGRIRSLDLRLGVPNHPGDRMHLTGGVRSRDGGVAALDVGGPTGRGQPVGAVVSVDGERADGGR